MGHTGLVTAVTTNGALSYLVHDVLGSVSLALSTSGSATGVQLFAPYGALRYQTGTMPTTFGFANQRLDGSGLNYMQARYYDPTLGQFTSADTVQGLNRYGYVGGNPETRTDPTGQCGGLIPCFAGEGDFEQCIPDLIFRAPGWWGEVFIEVILAGLI